MKCRRIVAVVFLLLVFSSLGTAQAAGQERAQGDEKQDQTIALRHSASVRWLAKHTGLSVETAYWIALGFNFLILVALLGKAMGSLLPKFFRARSETIRKDIEDAARASQEANARLSAIETKLARLDREIEEMRSHAESTGKQEEERMLAANEREKQSILASAEQEISAATNQLRRQLKQYAAQLAIQIAEEKISITAAADRELVSEFAGRLGKDERN